MFGKKSEYVVVLSAQKSYRAALESGDFERLVIRAKNAYDARVKGDKEGKKRGLHAVAAAKK